MRNIFSGILSLFLTISFAQNNNSELVDSIIDQYRKNPKESIPLVKEKIANLDSKDAYLTARYKSYLAVLYRDSGLFTDSKELSNEVINSTKDSIILGSSFNNLGAVNRKLGAYEEALDNYIKALAIYDHLNFKPEQATVNNNIGLVYSYLGANKKAIEYHLKAKESFESLDNKKGISEVYNNIAIVYANDGDLEKSLDYFKYSLQIEESLNDIKGIAESQNNVGAVFYYLQEIDSALVYFNKSAALERRLKNFPGVADSYNNIAQTLIETNRVNESKVYIDSAYYYSEKYNLATGLESALYNYSSYFEEKNDNKKALQYYKELTKFRDSLVSVETASKVAEIDVKYQTEKKEKEILAQRAEIAEQELDISEKKSQMLGLGILAVVLGLLGFLFYNQQKLKNRQLQKENELKDALLKIETQNKLQEQRLRISRDLHDNIGAQLTFIISSLDNLKYGFKLPDKLSNKLSSISSFTSSTIQELRDTIWAMNKNDISFEDLKVRLSNFIEKADKVKDTVVFDFKLSKALPDQLSFTSVKGMNIYRIIQEAVNNALKYSEASKIKVSVDKTKDELLFSVNDNGKGFDIEKTDLGNGLNNMKKRAEEIKGVLDIKSKTSEGTEILLRFQY
ncbi:tetratricopeptide repeat protein [Ichthyenterobacterium sp. W332]|uniref:histidine kinase n=1 Tax=Microcosmobacter mediterraneus TaxID=3075607 RepID=A0ABU2YIP8_9FLAO|nr:tetratricopeptide repeat protein [Ichthyenterobacterium sp. W332]MDT0557110.1 tetratricopeptide repeat protein [Ichthyenterobacterium sp. W332]